LARAGPSRSEALVAGIEARLFPVLQRISEEPHMAAVRDAMTPAFIGLIVVTIVAFFVPPEWALREGYAAFTTRFFAAYHVGFGAMGIVLTVRLADRLARTFGLQRVVAAGLSLAAFVSALKWPLDSNVATELGDISSTSILLGLVVALAVCEALRAIAAIVRGRIAAHVLGAAAVAVVFGILAAAHVSLGDILLTVIKPLVSASDSLPGLLLVVFFQTLLWTAGIHGPAFLSGIVTPLFLKAMDENSQAIAHHQAPPHIVTIMLSTFYYPGGSGATLSLAIAMVRSKIARLRKLALASMLPSLWNINELIIFGVPLVMNPSLALPFLAVPLVLATVTYVATSLGLVGHTIVYLPPVFPSVVTAWLTTAGDWRAVALVLVNIAIGVAIYTPFLRAYEQAVLAQPSAQKRLLENAEAIREHARELELHPERTAQHAP
jgi:PTS system cellobiose-specific IIC component